jgi:uncharacterized protein (DUF1330 family)
MSEATAQMIVTCRIDPSNKAALVHYITHARPLFAQYGGRPSGQYVVQSSITGSSDTTHIIVMEFPSADAIRAVMADEAYQALIPARTLAFPTLDILIAAPFEPASLTNPA